jgi:hypothetical protein
MAAATEKYGFSGFTSTHPVQRITGQADTPLPGETIRGQRAQRFILQPALPR